MKSTIFYLRPSKAYSLFQRKKLSDLNLLVLFAKRTVSWQQQIENWSYLGLFGSTKYLFNRKGIPHTSLTEDRHVQFLQGEEGSRYRSNVDILCIAAAVKYCNGQSDGKPKQVTKTKNSKFIALNI